MVRRREGALALALLMPLGCYAGVDATFADNDGGSTGGETEAEAGSSGDSGEDTEGEDEPAACGPDAVPGIALGRVNRDGYINALRDVFGEAVTEELDVVLSAIPSGHIGHFSTELGAPSYAEVSAQVNAAFAVAGHLTANSEALAQLLPCLPDVPEGATLGDDACLDELTRTYGRRLLRRPLTDADLQRFADDYAVGADHNVAEGVATLLTAMMVDPDFLYDRQVGEGDGALVTLTPHETAARLARVLWNSVPDTALLDAADAGLDEASVRAEAERMLDDPRARVALQGFFFDWMELEGVPFATEDAIPDAEARTALRSAMGDAVTEFASATVLDGEGAYADLLLDRTAYIDNEDLAALYEVSVSAGPVTLPDTRAGLLTRAGFLATEAIPGTNAGHLIKRGARLSAFVCRPLPLPDADNFPQDDPAEPGENPTQGIRERFAQATADPTCNACHVQLDSFGAPMGHFGSLGQWIDAERVGEAELPIDTAAEVLLDGQAVPLSDAVTLSEALASSVEGPRCLAQSLARNMLGRALTEDDACLVDELARALSGETDGTQQSVRAALIDFVSSDRFRRVRTP